MTRGLACRRFAISGVIWAALAPAWAAAVDRLSCRDAAGVAEAAEAVPAGLLRAIAEVESSRVGAERARAPWPWTIQAENTGRFFSTAEEAISTVQTLRAAGVQSIDIGCFQINLFHHSDAFPDLASGFDPLINALTAARFLSTLRHELGAWEPAVAAYHSRVDALGGPYRDQVLAVWQHPLIRTETNPVRVHVWGPAGELNWSARTMVSAWPMMHARTSRSSGLPGMPLVITLAAD